MQLENTSQTQRKLKNRNGSYHDYELSSPDPWSKNLRLQSPERFWTLNMPPRSTKWKTLWLAPCDQLQCRHGALKMLRKIILRGYRDKSVGRVLAPQTPAPVLARF